MNVKQEDVFRLLEAQRVEHLLLDRIASSATPNISDQYYSQVLMAQRLQRAQLEVELYRLAILRDGLGLLGGVYSFIINSLFGGRILTDGTDSDEDDECDEEQERSSI
jgi:hypothetical protein